MTALALLHSPVTGPATWRWVAQRLAADGHQLAVVAVPGEITAHGWEAFVEHAAEQVANLGRPVLVGHSGAGLLLPQIAGRVPASGLIFVDSDVPPESGEAKLMPDDILSQLRELASGGMLPAWSEWFGPDVMAELVPDAAKRAIVAAELPQIPLAYFEDRLPVPPGWTRTPCGYVLLSEGYASEAATAADRGWPVERLQGGHLELVTRPDEVAAAIESVATKLTTH